MRKRFADTLEEQLAPCIREVFPERTPGAQEAKCFTVKPAPTLQLAFNFSGEFGDLFWRILHPAFGQQTVGTERNPLRMICYNDEVTPGNAMDPLNTRKFSG